MDFLQKSIRYGPVIFDSSLSKNVQDTQQSHEIYHESYEKLESGFNGEEKL